LRDRIGVGVEIGKIVFLGDNSYSLVQTLLLYRMYRLATIHFVTDGHTDRQTDGQSCQ